MKDIDLIINYILNDPKLCEYIDTENFVSLYGYLETESYNLFKKINIKYSPSIFAEAIKTIIKKLDLDDQFLFSKSTLNGPFLMEDPSGTISETLVYNVKEQKFELMSSDELFDEYISENDFFTHMTVFSPLSVEEVSKLTGTLVNVDEHRHKVHNRRIDYLRINKDKLYINFYH